MAHRAMGQAHKALASAQYPKRPFGDPGALHRYLSGMAAGLKTWVRNGSLVCLSPQHRNKKIGLDALV